MFAPLQSSMFYEMRFLPPTIAVAVINLVDRTLPVWSSQARDSSFECSLTLLSYYRSLPDPTSSLSHQHSSQSTLRQHTFSSMHTSQPRTSTSSISTSSASFSAPSQPSFGIAATKLIFASSSQPSAPTSGLDSKTENRGDDEWDSIYAELDIEACINQAEENKRMEEKKQREIQIEQETILAAKKKEEEERQTLKNQQRAVLNERNNMELLVKHLRYVTENVKKAVLFERNTYTTRTSLVHHLYHQ